MIKKKISEIKISGGIYDRILRPIEINNVNEEFDKIEKLIFSNQSLILPKNTSMEDIDKILNRLYEKFFKIYKKDINQKKKSLDNIIYEISNINNVIENNLK